MRREPPSRAETLGLIALALVLSMVIGFVAGAPKQTDE